MIILFTGSLNLTVIIESQKAIWYIIPLFPIFIIFFIGALAETNRSPMDLAEAKLRIKTSQVFDIILQEFCLSYPFLYYLLFYNTKPLSKNFIILRPYSTINNNMNKNNKNIKSSSLNPDWIAGFTDAEGSFMVKLYESKSRSLGWRVEPVFQI